MSKIRLEAFSKKANEWKIIQESEDKGLLESMINWNGEYAQWRIISKNEVDSVLSFNGHYQETILELHKKIKGIDVLKKLENSPYLKSRGYTIQNAYTHYKDKGTILEVEKGERLQSINAENAISHDMFLECLNAKGPIYLQILPFPSKREIDKIPYMLNSGKPLTVLKDLNEFIKELG